MNKAQSTEAPTAAARACRPGRVGVGYLWPDVEWERRHVAQVWFSDHQIIAENPATTTKESLPCRFCSWAHGRRTARGGSDASAPTFVRGMVRKRQSSSCSFDQRLAVGGRPRRLAAVCRGKGDHTRRRHLVKDGQRVKDGNKRPPHAPLVALAWSSGRRWWPNPQSSLQPPPHQLRPQRCLRPQPGRPTGPVPRRAWAPSLRNALRPLLHDDGPQQ